MHSLNIVDSTWHIQYLNSFYFNTVTMVTVGYGDITPKTHLEKFFNIFILLSACGVFAYSITEVGNIFLEMNKSQNQRKRNMLIINNYMKKKRIRSDLQYQIRYYLEYYWNESLCENENKEKDIINQLSNNLKENLRIEANKIVAVESPFFRDNFSLQTILKTVSITSDQRCTPEEIIYLSGDQDDSSIYFIEKGSVQIFHSIDDHFSSINTNQINNNNNISNNNFQQSNILRAGDYFGELQFFTGKERSQNIRSLEFTTLIKIERNKFLEVVKECEQDYEKYCLIRDDIIFNNNLISTQKKCFYCKSEESLDPFHLQSSCPMVHYTPNLQKLQDKFWRGYREQTREPMNRTCTREFNSLGRLEQVVGDSNRIQYEFQGEIEEYLQENGLIQEQFQNDSSSFYTSFTQSSQTNSSSSYNYTDNANNSEIKFKQNQNKHEEKQFAINKDIHSKEQYDSKEINKINQDQQSLANMIENLNQNFKAEQTLSDEHNEEIEEFTEDNQSKQQESNNKQNKTTNNNPEINQIQNINIHLIKPFHMNTMKNIKTIIPKISSKPIIINAHKEIKNFNFKNNINNNNNNNSNKNIVPKTNNDFLNINMNYLQPNYYYKSTPNMARICSISKSQLENNNSNMNPNSKPQISDDNLKIDNDELNIKDLNLPLNKSVINPNYKSNVDSNNILDEFDNEQHQSIESYQSNIPDSQIKAFQTKIGDIHNSLEFLNKKNQPLSSQKQSNQIKQQTKKQSILNQQQSYHFSQKQQQEQNQFFLQSPKSRSSLFIKQYGQNSRFKHSLKENINISNSSLKEFDKMKLYKIYFPQNNSDVVINQYNRKFSSFKYKIIKQFSQSNKNSIYLSLRLHTNNSKNNIKNPNCVKQTKINKISVQSPIKTDIQNLLESDTLNRLKLLRNQDVRNTISGSFQQIHQINQEEIPRSSFDFSAKRILQKQKSNNIAFDAYENSINTNNYNNNNNINNNNIDKAINKLKISDVINQVDNNNNNLNNQNNRHQNKLISSTPSQLLLSLSSFQNPKKKSKFGLVISNNDCGQNDKMSKSMFTPSYQSPTHVFTDKQQQ